MSKTVLQCACVVAALAHAHQLVQGIIISFDLFISSQDLGHMDLGHG